MGIDVSSVQVLLNELLEVGAMAVVLSDTAGLVIANAISKQSGSSNSDILTESLGALSAIVIPQGEQVANYLSTSGHFMDTVIHTTSADGPRSVLAYSLESDPQSCIMIISEPALESQLIHEFYQLKDKITNAIQGLAVEIRDLTPNLAVDRKVEAFWETLEAKVKSAVGKEELKRALLDAKENFFPIHGSYSTIPYSMNAASNRIKGSGNFDVLKSELLSEITIWKKKLFGEVDEKEENKSEESVE